MKELDTKLRDNTPSSNLKIDFDKLVKEMPEEQIPSLHDDSILLAAYHNLH